MAMVVETQTMNGLEFLAQEGGKELFDGKNRVGDLCGRIEC